jgi:probable phosphoglycerate mutase
VNELWLARHGETEWTISKRHTSHTDLDLTPKGGAQAAALGRRLREVTFATVLTSPALRAQHTAELAGFPDAHVDPDLREFDYGDYEGITTKEILEKRPDWNLWRDGCPGGETTPDVAARADRVLERVARSDGPVLIFGHGHTSRVVTARYLGLSGEAGALFVLGTGALSHLGAEHGRPAMLAWNDTAHLSS